MSDCSIKAFEAPKTCGNCGNGCYESTVYCTKLNEDMAVNYEACARWVSSNEKHLRCDAITQLEQRYQQLEQVAKEMFQDIELSFVMGKFNQETYADYRDRLEAAGVETYGFKTGGEDD